MHFTILTDDGNSIELTPKSFAPFGLIDLWSLKNEVVSHKLEFSAINPQINGEIQTGDASISGKFTFNEAPEPFALVPGGWLPMPFVKPQSFLVDRNVVDRLKKIHGINKSTSMSKFKFWLQFMELESTLFNPLLYAWEGSRKRTPSFSEFVDEFKDGALEK